MIQAMRMFQHDAASEKCFIRVRWPQGSQCGADFQPVESDAKDKTMPFRFRACNERFSVSNGTVMQHANLGFPSLGHGDLSVHDQLEVSLVHEDAL